MSEPRPEFRATSPPESAAVMRNSGSGRVSHHATREPRPEVTKLGPDRRIAALAAVAHLIVTTSQLLAEGLSHEAISTRVARGWLTRIHRGVYLVGPTPGAWTYEAAALAACGPAATLSHRSAAVVWGMCERRDGPIDVTVPATVRRREGVRVHRARLAPGDVTRRHDLAVTIPDRTLLDLATTLPRTELELAVNEALVRKAATVRGLRSYLARHPARPGVAALSSVLHDDRGITRSRAERQLQALIRKAGIPPPLRNVRVAGYEVGCFWPDLGLVVEVDSAGFHGTPWAFQVDRAKEAALNDAGLRLIRVTRWEVVRRPEATIARLARATSPATAARPP